jgi:hypothetical protein
MQQHVPEGNDSRPRPTAVFTVTAFPDAGQCIEPAGPGPNNESTSLPLGGMTKARVHGLTRFAGSEMFTLSQSFGPEPEVGFGGCQRLNT